MRAKEASHQGVIDPERLFEEVLSEADTITLTHTARSREGFAAGAALAAEMIANKQGVYEFSELLFS